MNTGLHETLATAAAAVESRLPWQPAVGLVLGSGLGQVATRLDDPVSIPYEEIPGFHAPTVAGHAGRLVAGRAGNAKVIALQGRFHYYEGHSFETVTLPIRVLAALGVRSVVLTAAVGGIRPDLRPGQVVCICDHLNLMGTNPLRGIADPRLGPRFVDLTEVYNRAWRDRARAIAAGLGIHLTEGVYAGLCGPTYETPAEIRMLRALGADVVGMSLVPEAIVARQCGLDVLGLALVTNAAAGLSESPITHEEVIGTAREAEDLLSDLILQVLAELAAESA